MSREIPDEPTIRYADHGPIAPDCWQPGPHSFDHAREVITERVQNIRNKHKRHVAEVALLGRLAAHSERNHDGFSEVQQTLDESARQKYRAVIEGAAQVPDYIRFLHEYPKQRSIEVARLIHPGDWDVRESIDIPVRTMLVDPDNQLETQFLADDSRYKIVQFGEMFGMVTVDRKRDAMSHFGDAILTVVRNSVLIDTNHAPDELKDYIFQEMAASMKPGYDYDRRSKVLQNALEDHIRVRDTGEKPRWAIPLMTTYYAALKKRSKSRS